MRRGPGPGSPLQTPRSRSPSSDEPCVFHTPLCPGSRGRGSEILGPKEGQLQPWVCVLYPISRISTDRRFGENAKARVTIEGFKKKVTGCPK